MSKNSRGMHSGAKYQAAWRQRRYPALAILVLGPLAGYALARALPARFASVARLEWKGAQAAGGVEAEGAPPAPPNLAFVEGRILTAERLAPVIAKHGLYVNEAGAAPGKDPVERMRRDLSIKPAANGFSISFSAHDARVAQSVCQDVVALFLEAYPPGNVEEQRTDGGPLVAQVQQAKRKLDQQEARLEEFMRQHYRGGVIDDPVAPELLLMTLNARLTETRTALGRAVENKALTENLLQQQLDAWHHAPAPESPKAHALEQELAAKQAQLSALETRYTHDYPDVVKLRNNIVELQKRLADAKAAETPLAPKDTGTLSPGEPAEIAQTRALLQQLNRTIQEKTSERQRLEQEIQNAGAKQQASKQEAQQLDALTNSYNASNVAYQNLLAQQRQAEAARAARQPRQSAELRVVSPPTLPEKPSFPDSMLFTFGGAGCGLGLGLVTFLAGAWSDTTLRTTEDVERYLGLPTLAMIPTVGTDHEGGKPGTRGGGRRGNPGTREESVLVDV